MHARRRSHVATPRISPRARWALATVLLLAAMLMAAAAHAEGDIAATVVDAHGMPVADAVVVAVPVDGAMRLPSRHESVVDQVDKEFTPKVNAILVGTSVVFPNHDNVRHQVYSFSRAKRFELPLYAGVPAQPVVFDTPGVVVLGCNIHDWMIGYVYVSESPYFAKTGADGKVVIANLTPRVYKVRVWHPQLDGTEESTQRDIDLSHAKRVETTWTLKLKPETRVRRSPVGEHAGHY